MSAPSNENTPALDLAKAAWQPAGLLYLAIMLLALAAGIWPQAVYPPRQSPVAAPLPTLQTLAVAQAAFALLVYPLILLRRALARGSSGAAGYWSRTIVESVFFILASVPFYILAALVSDATAGDTVRVGLCAASCFPLAWASGAHFASRRAGQWCVLLVLMIIAMGLPAAFYVALEFFPAGLADWLGNLSPLLLTWQNGASRLGEGGERILPAPLWGWLAWPALAGVALLTGMIIPRRHASQG